MIPLIRLHHVSLATGDLASAKRFFGEILGLPEIERPGFNFPGAWYALGDRQLHLIADPLSGPDVSGRTSRSDHLALEVSDLESVESTLRRAGVRYELGSNQTLGLHQLFCRDPDGHAIEFICRAAAEGGK